MIFFILFQYFWCFDNDEGILLLEGDDYLELGV